MVAPAVSAEVWGSRGGLAMSRSKAAHSSSSIIGGGIRGGLERVGRVVCWVGAGERGGSWGPASRSEVSADMSSTSAVFASLPSTSFVARVLFLESSSSRLSALRFLFPFAPLVGAGAPGGRPRALSLILWRRIACWLDRTWLSHNDSNLSCIWQTRQTRVPVVE